MTKTIDTLAEDIGRVLTDPPEITDEQADGLGHSIAKVIREKLSKTERKPALRMSNLGTQCLRKLWYTVNKPEAAIPLRPEARLKFLYGDIIETLVLWLAKLAGHEVKGEQDELDINGIKGHRDAVIDGVTADVKSASTYSYAKFRDHLKPSDDAFGYLTQIGAYVYAGRHGDEVREKTTGAFVAVDKTLGHIVVDRHEDVGTEDYSRIVEERKAIVSQDTPPPRAYFDEPDGKSGNRKLGLQCGYCDFREECWPGLRTFNYAGKPRYLTKVVREPNIEEVK